MIQRSLIGLHRKDAGGEKKRGGGAGQGHEKEKSPGRDEAVRRGAQSRPKERSKKAQSFVVRVRAQGPVGRVVDDRREGDNKWV